MKLSKFPSIKEKKIYIFIFFFILLIIPTFLFTSIYLFEVYAGFVYNFSSTLVNFLERHLDIYQINILFTLINNILLSLISIFIYGKSKNKKYFWRIYAILIVLFYILENLKFNKNSISKK